MEIPADKDTYCAEKHIFHLPGQRGDPLCWVKWNVWFQLLSVVRLCTNFDEKKRTEQFYFFVLFKKKKTQSWSVWLPSCINLLCKNFFYCESEPLKSELKTVFGIYWEDRAFYSST